jgi:serine protease Do
LQPATDKPLAPSVQPQTKPVPPSQSELSRKPTMKSDVAQPVPARPYNLDQLISDRAKAEADLEDMIKDMRGKMDRR